MFQFHIGAIKRSTVLSMYIAKYARFNSILVRLKVKLGRIILTGLLKFQFHIGAIKRREREQERNSILSVSIPYWCD